MHVGFPRATVPSQRRRSKETVLHLIIILACTNKCRYISIFPENFDTFQYIWSTNILTQQNFEMILSKTPMLTCFFCFIYKSYIAQCQQNGLTHSKILQKQPSRGVLKKRCSKNMQQIYRTPTPNCDFNKVAKQFY